MFSYFGKRSANMAFIPSPERFARAAALQHAETTLAAYLQGREKEYAVRDAVSELQALFGPGAVQPTRLIETALQTPPDAEETRLRLVTEALDMIGQQVRADRDG